MNGGLGVEVNVAGDAGFIRKLRGLVGLMDFSEALRETGENLKEYFGGQVFESHGGVYGTPWKALSPATVAFKSRHFRQFAAVPLQATGEMRRSFAYHASATHLEIINEAPYFKYHQSTEPRKKLPRRPMFAINRDVKAIIRHSFEKAMAKKIGGL